MKIHPGIDIDRLEPRDDTSPVGVGSCESRDGESVAGLVARESLPNATRDGQSVQA